ncbi:interferon a3-like [Conger conger]|uniref:interferon a3-like n=1 Tax=Conger conger TaxID=82655 RepID=UPI002A59E044|nr:interferon a3-like [Conger conger]
MCMLKFWSICAVLLFLDHSVSLQCKWTQYKLGKLNAECIQLLTDMGGSFPAECLKENVKLMFPEGAYDTTSEPQKSDAATVAHDALRDVEKIFHNDLSSTSWDPEKLELLKNLLSRQTENLEQCVGSKITSSGDGSRPSDDNGRLKPYFERLNTLLKEKSQSACAWEVVRKEVRHSLEKLQQFLERRNKQ